ncbi:MAG TPA: guanylate kinase [Deltaproteobacteria bacterium]|nr:guanylate kinase [Deltaproteobacteria bacterium]HQI01212.1 guanylate kinase [Deltaproteobacteria bacterium]HQJ08491.1 guanylate kinase [Deltaproteobacteria bacterium]
MRIFISGPSGVGKSTIISEVLKRNPDIVLSVSYTTRKPRPEEMHGREYYFISPQEFEEMVSKGVFLEWAQVHDHTYGTSLDWVSRYEKEGKHILFDIDVQGVRQARERGFTGSYVFIIPPSIDELAKRLKHRGTENEKSFSLRLKNAREELRCWKMYDYIVVNGVIGQAVKDVQSIIDATRCSRTEMAGRIPWLQEIG